MRSASVSARVAWPLAAMLRTAARSWRDSPALCRNASHASWETFALLIFLLHTSEYLVGNVNRVLIRSPCARPSRADRGHAPAASARARLVVRAGFRGDRRRRVDLTFSETRFLGSALPWTNTSGPPSSGRMNPKCLRLSHHFTTPDGKNPPCPSRRVHHTHCS